VSTPAGFVFHDGVYFHRESDIAEIREFENAYLKLRNAEQRFLTPQEIRRLPEVDSSRPDSGEWRIRGISVRRFVNYVKQKERALRIMEVGCGNAFLSHLLAEQGNKVCAVDVNRHELLQAAVAFTHADLKLCHLDLFKADPPDQPFDLIVFAASIQYFKDASAIIARCVQLLSDRGEIHIFDSPFYPQDQKMEARIRSLAHFQSCGAGEFAGFYHHLSIEDLGQFRMKTLYRPLRIRRMLNPRSYSPFPWLCLKKMKG
jgi:2-polyprenyl-3-methyl-5-hydroxy-6-metoxy-1,4-benzoquinol methylase